eukprot:Seg443.8 transcript_id=Seg443.8/GoldUCD/mRNA.D3Y31 product="Proton-coupled folate transporter" protein_id=Seg443.8/GoldUCD/D3Y31
MKLKDAKNKMLAPGKTGAVTMNTLFALNAITLTLIRPINAMYDKTVACSSSATSFVRCELMPPIANEKARANIANPNSIPFVVVSAIDTCVASMLTLPMVITVKSDGREDLAAMNARSNGPAPRIVCRVKEYKPISSDDKFKGLCLTKSVMITSSPYRAQT